MFLVVVSCYLSPDLYGISHSISGRIDSPKRDDSSPWFPKLGICLTIIFRKEVVRRWDSDGVSVENGKPSPIASRT